MATTNQPKQENTSPEVRNAEAQVRPKQAENARGMLKYRDEHVGAREAAQAGAEAVAKAEREVNANSVASDQTHVVVPVQNQVPQEGALVETPPQPVPPAYTDAQLREMDHAPLGYREPSLAAGASKFEDFDQTVHPQSRVDDPSKPL